ncbi:MAG TPA: Asp-tRNA(Asn)/Glu-tRNA(Gln) amidotransferase subunit GatA [bacterium]|nr:Asp-tRNA(Asn)/Glu-tRNA(Gln) amidotransferase subunit GatA [bacterium]
MDLNNLTLAAARQLLDNRQITSRQLTEYYLRRLKKYDDQVHASLLIDETGALKQADEADQRLISGDQTGVLGIPYLVKDNILTKGLKTTAASKILADYIAPYDATVIAKLRQSGAVLLGKANLDEFAHGTSTENSAMGPTKNPYDLERVPGGSSGGSAAAVAADFCLFALGSDTGGSVRHPASLCGVVGYKPSYGAISRHGLIAMASSTDVIGILAKTASDAASVLRIIAGQDKFDATAQTKLATAKIKDKINWADLRIGWPDEYVSTGLDLAVLDSLTQVKIFLQEHGAKIIPLSLPSTKYGVAVYHVITSAEVSANLARFDGLRYGYKQSAASLNETYLINRGHFGAEAKRRIMLGTYILSAGDGCFYYNQAQRVRRWISYDFDQAWEKVDFLLTPTVPRPAFRLSQKINDPLSLYLEDALLTPASLAGVPAVSWPTGWSGDGLPIGSQLIGPLGNDYDLLTLTQAMQTALPCLRRRLAWEK